MVKLHESLSEAELPVIRRDGVLAVRRGSKLFWGFVWLNFEEGVGMSRYSTVAL